MATVELRGLRKEIGGTPIVRGVDLSIADGELLVLVGPSGCSKTTLLRLISGLDEPSSGEIWIGGRRVDGLPPAERDVAMVFQSYALYPHMTVRENLEFGLVLRKVARAEIDRRVEEVAALLELSPLLARRPRELSGGQRQRVAMGRAIVRRPAVFLFDEPLSNLDASLRSQVRLQLQKLHRQIGTTSVYVTHDQIEAMTLADRLAVLRAGQLQQIGPPLDVYRWPANRFVAGFLGNPSMSFVRAVARAAAGGFRAEGNGFSLALPEAEGLADGAQLWIGVRPQDLAFAGPATDSLRGSVEAAELIGWEAFVQVRVGDACVVVRTEAAAAARLAPGQAVELTVPRDALLLFDAESERALPPPRGRPAASAGGAQVHAS